MIKRIMMFLTIFAFVIGTVAACRKVEKSLSTTEILTLGEKHLLEMNYEQALVQFLSVIELEPMNPRGYTGAAAAYVGLNDIDKAIEILRQGQEQLPNEASIQAMLNDLAEAPVPSEDESPTPDAPLWDSFTDGQKAMLDRLEQAAEMFAHEAVYEIMTSSEFLELYSQLGIQQNEGGWAMFKTDEN